MHSSSYRLVKRAKGFCGFLLLFFQIVTAALLSYNIFAKLVSFELDYIILPTACAISVFMSFAYLIVFCRRNKPGTALLKIVNIIKLITLCASEVGAVFGIVWASMFEEKLLWNDITVLSQQTGLDLSGWYYNKIGYIMIFGIAAAVIAVMIAYTAMTINTLSVIKKAYRGTSKKGSTGLWGILSVLFSILLFAASVISLTFDFQNIYATILLCAYLALYAMRFLSAGIIGLRWFRLASEYAVIDKFREQSPVTEPTNSVPVAAIADSNKEEQVIESGAQPEVVDETALPSDEIIDDTIRGNAIKDEAENATASEIHFEPEVPTEPEVPEESMFSEESDTTTESEVHVAAPAIPIVEKDEEAIPDSTVDTVRANSSPLPVAATAASAYTAVNNATARNDATEATSYNTPIPVGNNGLFIYPYPEIFTPASIRCQKLEKH